MRFWWLYIRIRTYILSFILFPFRNAKFLKRKFRAHGVLTPKRHAQDLVIQTMEEAWKTLEDSEFQRLCEFSKQDDSEKSRIFSELTVAAVVLLKLALEDSIWALPPELKPFWCTVDEQIMPTFRRWMRDLKFDPESVKLSQKLFQLRFAAFKENVGMAREELAEHFKDSKPRRGEAILNPAVVRVTNAAVSTLFYLRKGEDNPQDRLAQYLLWWMTSLDKQLSKKIGW